MSEAVLCNLGKTPKTFSYLDDEHYNQIICKLQENITELKLKEFFNKVYSMKLDSGFSKSFADDYNTSDLIKCFTKILISDKLIDLRDLYNIINKKDQKEQSTYLPVEFAIEEFFSMFEITEEYSYTVEEYNAMIRQYAMNRVFCDPNSLFSQESESIDENSRIVNSAQKRISSEKGLIKIRKINRKSNLS